jgi:uncharacterized tellurite resistance protein B-like protein
MKKPTFDQLARQLAGLPPGRKEPWVAGLLTSELERLERDTKAGRKAKPASWLVEALAVGPPPGGPAEPGTDDPGGWFEEIARRFARDAASEPPPLPWQQIRCHREQELLAELTARFDLSPYLEACRHTLDERHRRVRDRLLLETLRLTPALSPRVFGVYQDACRRLRVEPAAELFCRHDPRPAARAILDDPAGGPRPLVELTSGAVECLDDDQLAALIGHELGHFLLGQWQLAALWNDDPAATALTQLPPLGESIYLRWRQFGEINADRVAVIAAGGFRPAAEMLARTAFGLSTANLHLDPALMLAQLAEAGGGSEAARLARSLHPVAAVRLRAMECFARSAKAALAGLDPGPEPLDDEALERETQRLVALVRRSPAGPGARAVMRAVACGGLLLLAADGDVRDEELRILVGILHRDHIDDPEAELVAGLPVARRRLAAALRALAARGSPAEREQVVASLAEIALADGSLHSAESAFILEVAAQLGLPHRATWKCLMQQVAGHGPGNDRQLNSIATALREDLRRWSSPAT